MTGNCMSCAFFERDDGQEIDQGNCKRYPPHACYDPEHDCGVSVWPLVVWTDWCGEHITRQEYIREGKKA